MSDHSKHEQRKQVPVFSGVLRYFPDAIWAVARCSKIGNDQHNDPSLPMHWDRNKSTDEPDALVRHLMQYDEMDDDGLLHATKVAWRALALLQKTLEARGEAPLDEANVQKDGERAYEKAQITARARGMELCNRCGEEYKENDLICIGGLCPLCSERWAKLLDE